MPAAHGSCVPSQWVFLGLPRGPHPHRLTWQSQNLRNRLGSWAGGPQSSFLTVSVRSTEGEGSARLRAETHLPHEADIHDSPNADCEAQK